MGLPLSVPISVYPLLCPNATTVMRNSYNVSSCLWTWGNEPQGEPSYAVLHTPRMYLAMSPEQFDEMYPDPTSGPTTTYTPPITATATTSEEPNPTSTMAADSEFQIGKAQFAVRRHPKRKYSEMEISERDLPALLAMLQNRDEAQEMAYMEGVL